MPALTPEQLAALARSGANNRQIEAMLGHTLAGAELATVDKARVVSKLQRDVKRNAKKLGSADRHAVLTAEKSKVDRVPCEDPKRRARLESGPPVDWLRHYMSGTYSRPFERPHTEIVEGVMQAHESHGRFVVAAERGVGKALALDTQIPTPTGWTTMGALRVGDQVFDDDGKPCAVIAKSEVFKNRPVYAVEINHEKDTIIADAEHVWVAEMDRRKGFRQYTTKQIAEPTNVSQSRTAVKVAPALVLADTPLSVDPYFLGVWLGDGNSNQPTITTADNETVAWLESFASRLGMRTRDNQKGDTHHVSLCQHKLIGKRKCAAPSLLRIAERGQHTKGEYRCHCGAIFTATVHHVNVGNWQSCGCLLRNPLKDALESLGVLNNKHIPPAYLRASTEQRMQLLRGLIDTDGHVTSSGCVEFCNTSRRLTDGVVELVRTLGVKAFLHEDRARVNGKDCGPRYRVTFHMAGCATIPRKAARCRDAGTLTRHYLHATPCGTADTVCIQVSASSGMFLAGRSMTPTHNSAILWGMILYLALSGRQRYPVCVPWADKALKRAFRFWKNALCYNDALGADYPEFCAPFRHSRGVPQRVMTCCWRDTSQPCGAQLTVGEGMIVLPDRLGCIGGSTINGNIRGLNHPQDDGTVLRPTIALLDDVQDRQTAKSPVQVADTCAIIDGDVGGCGDPGRDLPMLMACNCIAPQDLSEHYLSHPEWHALRVPCIEAWPEGWADEKSRCRELWADWHERFLAGRGDKSFYRKNKREMTRGMKLSAPAAFTGSDQCPDAFYGVMRMYYRMGHEAFMAERQQQPVDAVNLAGPYLISPPMILSRRNGLAPMQVPDWCAIRLASTDINPSYAFSTVLPGFGIDQTAALLWHGLHPLAIRSDLPAPEFARQLFGQLTAHGRFLASLPCKPEAWGIDAGGTQFDAVVRFASESVSLCGIQAYAMTGRGVKAYKPYGKTAIQAQIREQCHGCMDQKEGRRIRWVAWNSDYWKEITQRAWLGEVGSPGSISIPTGDHSELAAQICNERLLGKGEVGGMMMWNWKRLPGRNDFGDAMAQSYALAAYVGIGTGGRVTRPQQRQNQRRVRHVQV
jgi:hypothetical protein